MTVFIPKKLERVYKQRQDNFRQKRAMFRRQLIQSDAKLKELDAAYQMAGLRLLQLSTAVSQDADAIALASKTLAEAAQVREQIFLQQEQLLWPEQARYVCTLCHDTGNYQGQLCSCAEDIMNQLEQQSGVSFPPPPSIRLADFDLQLFSEVQSADWYQGVRSPRKAAANFLKLAQLVVQAFPQDVKNLYLFGKTGTGKTWLAAAIANELRAKGYTVAFVRTMQCLDLYARWRILERSFQPDPEEHQLTRERVRYLQTADVLVLDDLGTETLNDTSYNDLITLIEQRTDHAARLTLLTGNIAPSQFFRRYDERIGSRIIGGFTIFEMEGPDLRVERARRS